MVTSDEAVDWAPVWSPDGRFLYFASDRGGSMGIWRIPMDETSGRSTGPPELIAAGVDVAMAQAFLSRVTDDLARDWAPKFTPDGTALVFFSNKVGTYDAWSIRLDGSNRTRLTAIADAEVAYTMLAPDGRQLAASIVPGQIVIGSAPFPMTRAAATTIDIQNVGGAAMFPSGWSRDGRWLTGPTIQPSGVQRGNALYDVKARTVRQLSDDAASIDMVWMPDNRRVIYFTTSGKLVIQNIESLARHEVAATLPLPPDDEWSIAASPDGRTIHYGAQQVEANIWKVERPKAR